MITLTIKNNKLDKYIFPETSSAPTIHIVVTKPRTSTAAIHSYVSSIYSETMKKSSNLKQHLSELPLSLVKGSTHARSLGIADKFIGLNPINISTYQKFCTQFVNYDGVKKNGFKLITNENLSNMSYLRSNSTRVTYTAIYVLKARDMLTYEIMKKLELNQHLLPPISDIYRLAQFIRLIITQNNPDEFRAPSVDSEV